MIVSSYLILRYRYFMYKFPGNIIMLINTAGKENITLISNFHLIQRNICIHKLKSNKEWKKKREKNIASCRVWTHVLTGHRKTEVKLHKLVLKSTLQKGGNALGVFYLNFTVPLYFSFIIDLEIHTLRNIDKIKCVFFIFRIFILKIYFLMQWKIFSVF